jgi:CubicO group peptidase (beta-lactamase class C family)
LKYVIFIFFWVLSLALQAQHKEVYEEVNKIIKFDSDITYDLTPGFIVGIIDNDSTYFLSFGNEVGSKNPLNKDHIFELGSITKSFTAAIVCLLEKDKIISRNDLVNQYLPIDFQNPRLKKLTIGDLIDHKSPFPKRPYYFGEKEEDPQNPYEFYTKNDLLKFYSRYVPDKQKEFNYSHINYALLEIVIESATNLEYEELLKKFLFDPLEMENSFVHFKEKKQNVVTIGVDRTTENTKPWTFSSFAGSEGIKTTASDLIHYLRAFMAASSTALDKNLPELTTYNNVSFNSKLFTSMGWHVLKINKNNRAILSNGGTNGHSAFIGMVPENKTGVVVLSNSSFGTKDLGLLILRMINYNWKRKAQ